MKRISLYGIDEQYTKLKPEIDFAIKKVLSHSKFIQGPEVEELEAALADFVGVKYCITCGNGSDGLTLALKSYLQEYIGTPKVLTTAFSFPATAEAIYRAKGQAIFVDINQETFNMSPIKTARLISTGFDAPIGIVSVDLFGLATDVLSRASAARKKVFVIEDACQAFGASLNGVMAGSIGDIGVTSFFPTKPLGCYGDGGAIFTNDRMKAKMIREFARHGGITRSRGIPIPGMNSRLDTIQAAVLLVKLKYLREELHRRQRIAEFYTRELSGYVKTPFTPCGGRIIPAWAQYSVLFDNRHMREFVYYELDEKGIETGIYYPNILSMKYRSRDKCPVALYICQRILSLPIHPYLTQEEMEYITFNLKQAVENFHLKGEKNE